MKIKEIMTESVIFFSPEDSIYEVAKKLRESRISGAPVLEGDKIEGVISEADIMKLVEREEIELNTFLPSPFDVLELPIRMKLNLDRIMKKIQKTGEMKVENVMTRKVITINQEEDVSKAASVMREAGINRLPVVNQEGKLVGILTRGDLLKAL